MRRTWFVLAAAPLLGVLCAAVQPSEADREGLELTAGAALLPLVDYWQQVSNSKCDTANGVCIDGTQSEKCCTRAELKTLGEVTYQVKSCYNFKGNNVGVVTTKKTAI
jgi:hypothetical protein